MNENEMIENSTQATEILNETSIPEKSGVVKKVVAFGVTALTSAAAGFAAGWKTHKMKEEKRFNERVEKALAEIEAKKAQEAESNEVVEEEA